jgi:hypothetical protein
MTNGVKRDLSENLSFATLTSGTLQRNEGTLELDHFDFITGDRNIARPLLRALTPMVLGLSVFTVPVERSRYDLGRSGAISAIEALRPLPGRAISFAEACDLAIQVMRDAKIRLRDDQLYESRRLFDVSDDSPLSA